MAEMNLSEEVAPEQISDGPDPLQKLYKNVTNKRIDVGDFDNFKRLMKNPSTQKVIYDDMVSAYGESVKKHIGQDLTAFSSLYGEQKKNQPISARFRDWWSFFFIPCIKQFKYVIFG